ncbi:MAG TPA: hypothetical protein VGO62_10575 [Myxococcota bacterium]
MSARKSSPSSRFTRARSLPRLPFVWRVATEAQAVGLRVHGPHVWAGNEKGEVLQLSLDGALVRKTRVPAAVHCLAVDEACVWAACVDGKIYDVTARVPKARFDLGPQVKIAWIELHERRLFVSDEEGGLTLFDAEGLFVWERRDERAKQGWMVRVDGDGIVHGSELGVRALDGDGRLLAASSPSLGDVRFGALFGDDIVVTAGWQRTRKSTLVVLARRAARRRLALGLNPRGRHNGAESCAVGLVDGEARVFASCGGELFCFALADGRPLWRAALPCGSACNMELVGNALFVASVAGIIARIDVSDKALTDNGPHDQRDS